MNHAKQWTRAEAREYLTSKGILYTREDYMANRVDHETYFGQFVTPRIINHVKMCIGTSKILASTDPHLNDISLHLWDAACGVRFRGAQLEGRPSIPDILPVALTESMCYADRPDGTMPVSYSVSDCVCTMKAAAREIQRRFRESDTVITA